MNSLDPAGPPYQFHEMRPLPVAPERLGDIQKWHAERICNGLRVQLVKRKGQVFLWSYDGGLISEQFPAVLVSAARLPDSVLDGELVAVQGNNVAALFVMVASDLLESAGTDWRRRPLHERRGKLHEVVYSMVLGVAEKPLIQVADVVRAPSWQTMAVARDQVRTEGTGGLVLKRRESVYGDLNHHSVGDHAWWIW